jgi:hypothetical protein
MQNGKLLSKDVLPRVSAQMKKMADEAGGLDRVSQMAVTGIGRVKAAMENDLNKAFTSSEKGLGQFNASVANMLNDASPNRRGVRSHPRKGCLYDLWSG